MEQIEKWLKIPIIIQLQIYSCIILLIPSRMGANLFIHHHLKRPVSSSCKTECRQNRAGDLARPAANTNSPRLNQTHDVLSRFHALLITFIFR